MIKTLPLNHVSKFELSGKDLDARQVAVRLNPLLQEDRTPGRDRGPRQEDDYLAAVRRLRAPADRAAPPGGPERELRFRGNARTAPEDPSLQGDRPRLRHVQRDAAHGGDGYPRCLLRGDAASDEDPGPHAPGLRPLHTGIAGSDRRPQHT